MQPPGKERESLIADLYERHATLILYAIQRQITRPEDAEDILLDVFLAALESDIFTRMDESAQVAWLRRVAHNKCADHYRRSYRRPVVSLEDAVPQETLYDDEGRTPEQVALREEEHRQLYEQLASLPAQHQEVVRLRFGAGMRCIDIAHKLQLSEGTVRGWLSRSLNQLRGMYANQQKEMC